MNFALNFLVLICLILCPFGTIKLACQVCFSMVDNAFFWRVALLTLSSVVVGLQDEF